MMLLHAGQVVRFKGRDGEDRARELERELCGRGERKGNIVTLKHRTHFKPNFAAEVPQLALEPGVLGNNGHRTAPSSAQPCPLE